MPYIDLSPGSSAFLVNEVPHRPLSKDWYRIPISSSERILVELKWCLKDDSPEENRLLAGGALPAYWDNGKVLGLRLRWCAENANRLQDGSRPWIYAEKIEPAVEREPEEKARGEVKDKVEAAEADDGMEEDYDDHGSAGLIFMEDPQTPDCQLRLRPDQSNDAVLKVLRLPKTIHYTSECVAKVEVGDCVQVIGVEHDKESEDRSMRYYVRSLRTRAEFSLPWNAFSAVGTRELCDCWGQKCRCVYEDYEKSKAFNTP